MNLKTFSDMNDFVKINIMGAGANGAHTENGAISYATSGKAIIDQFGKAGTYRGRSMDEVWSEQTRLWAEDPVSALRFPFYLRMITRQTNVGNGNKTGKVQNGQGAKDEAFKRLLWIAKYHPDEFYRNLWLLPVVGSWKDLWVLLTMDDSLNKEMFFRVMAEGIKDESTIDLVKKYMPRIRSMKKCGTEWANKTNELAKEFAKFAGWSYSDYRMFKSTGKAHMFQKYICSRMYDHINWNTIPGKALLGLVSGKFLANHSLKDSYISWLKTQPTVKFNGYPFELARKIYRNASLETTITVDKQFDGLIETASKDGVFKGNVLCGLDTSSSMTWTTLDNSGTMPYHVCLSLGIYFSELNKGAFHNVVADFNDRCTLRTLSGTFSEKWNYLTHNCQGWGSTNFQGLVDLVVDTRKKHPKIPLEDFPTTLLVVSDMQFNPAGSNRLTNYEVAMNKLRAVFPEKFVDDFKIVWWYCTNRNTNDVPATMDKGGQYLVSGFDGSIINLILNKKVDEKTGEVRSLTMEESVEAALNQEVLTLVQ